MTEEEEEFTPSSVALHISHSLRSPVIDGFHPPDFTYNVESNVWSNVRTAVATRVYRGITI